MTDRIKGREQSYDEGSTTISADERPTGWMLRWAAEQGAWYLDRKIKRLSREKRRHHD